MNTQTHRNGVDPAESTKQAVDTMLDQPSTSGRLLPFRLLYPVGSRKWNCRAAPNKRADLLGAYHDGQTILAQPVTHAGASWLAVQLPDGRIGWCKQYDEAHMVQHHNTRTGYGWYRVVYCSLLDEQTYGIGLETLTPELLQQLAAAPPAPPPAPGVPRSGGAVASVAAGSGGGCSRDRCSSCWLPLRVGTMGYLGSCGHSYHFECLKQLGDANICTACGVWYAVGQSPPDACPAPSPTSIFQHVHQHLWFVPPFYRYILIYGAMLLASPFLLLASWLGLI
ncbi:hypothetical protein PLESTB_000080200 [Pleodorina starrii]|uniref:RING-type domain-containing protein n=1 Tax=Pleodorina starrii TaxID=330485 RepID=A0A9W6BAY6_9CHLO|nr:hypothetical protein PLESTM_000076700 [Pleodorina starrii]GLC48292.1 hypothetical protein PLESTB_000080200 [Pleodorina starrii]GLC66578.1 hypothetical protein PLESTF_000446100 [Pleodorina starrii]